MLNAHDYNARLAIIAAIAQRNNAALRTLPRIEYDFEGEREVIMLCCARNNDARDKD